MERKHLKVQEPKEENPQRSKRRWEGAGDPPEDPEPEVVEIEGPTTIVDLRGEEPDTYFEPKNAKSIERDSDELPPWMENDYYHDEYDNEIVYVGPNSNENIEAEQVDEIKEDDLRPKIPEIDESLQNRIDNLRQLAAERKAEIDKIFSEQSKENKENDITKEDTDEKAKPPELKVDVKIKPEESNEFQKNIDSLNKIRDGVKELDTLDSIHQEVHEDIHNSSNWTQELEQNFTDFHDKIDTQKEITQFWAHFGLLNNNEITNNQTAINEINDQLYDEINQMQDFALRNPTSYEKNVEKIANRLNISKNNLVSEFREIGKELEKVDALNPYEMDKLADKMKDFDISKLEHEINKAYVKDDLEKLEAKMHPEKEESKNREKSQVKNSSDTKQHEKVEAKIEEKSVPESVKLSLEVQEKTKIREKKLVYENIKQVRGTEIRVYTDGTLEIKGSVSKNGVLVTNDVHQWKALPRSKMDGKISVKANYEFLDENGERVRIEEVESEILNNNYYTFIQPLDNEVKEKLRQNKTAICEISGIVGEKEQLESTENFKIKSDTASRTEIPDLTGLKLVVKGRAMFTEFEIYVDEDEKVVIKQNCKIGTSGEIWLAGEIGRYIEDWFESTDNLYCSLDGKEPIAIKPTLRDIRDKAQRKVKEITLPYWGQRTEVELVFSNPNLKLNEKAKENLKLKELLNKAGFKISSLKANHRAEGEHQDPKLEEEIKDIIKDAFDQDSRVIVLSEVEIIPENVEGVNKEANQSTFDNLIIHLDEKGDVESIDIVEIKTSTSPQKLKLVDNAISNLRHFVNRIGNENITPIVVMNDDMKAGNKIISKDFGDKIGVLVIGSEELNTLKENPKMLSERISEFKQMSEKTTNKESTRADSKGLTVDIHEDPEINELISERLSPEVEIIGQRAIRESGVKFELEVKEILEEEGFTVIPNVVVSYSGRRMEIDLIAVKDGEIEVVSCKDRSGSTNSWSVSTDIKNAANRIEFAKDLLSADRGTQYTKVNPKISERVQDRFHNKPWAENVNIKIIENKE
ncbi:MAG: hypothetical protein GPJ52_06795 [Candidatus Heimdallarchaeota archaeon]|nr:hypothetical protein [Candidatus Heimdallarchaeota archaeon]